MTLESSRSLPPHPNVLSRRAALLGFGAAGAGLALAATASAAPAQHAAPATSGGLGLTQTEWEAIAGTGEAGQGAAFYTVNDVKLAVLFDLDGDKRLISVSWSADSGQPGLALADAQAAAARYLPADAELRETYDVPGAGIAPIALIQLYRSATLKGAYSEAYAGSGNFVIWYRYSGTLELAVTAFDVFVGKRPTPAS